MSKVREIKLSNGLTLLYLHTPNDPVSACHIFLPHGAASDPTSKQGVTTLRWSMLLKGTQHRTAKRLAEDIEMLGGSMGVGVTQDYCELSCHGASIYFESLLHIFSETLFAPHFLESELQKEKEALIAAIRAKKESIYATASELLNQSLFPNHPYGRPQSGKEETMAQLKLEDLTFWNNQYFVPNGVIVSLATDIPFKKIKPIFEKLFGNTIWPHRKSWKPKALAKTPRLTSSKTVKKSEKFEQAYFMWGFPTEGINSKSYLAIKILNALLGGGMSTRLFQELREKNGLAYDVGSYYASKLSGSAFVIYMGLQSANLVFAKKKIQQILKNLQHDLVPEAELNLIKNYVKGTYLLDHQTNSQRAHYVGWWKILGKPLVFDALYTTLIQKITVKTLQKVARKIFGKPSIIVEIQPTRKGGTSLKESLSIV